MKLLLLRSKKGKTSDDSSKGSGGSRELKKSGHSRKHKDGAGGSLDKSKGSSGRFIITPRSDGGSGSVSGAVQEDKAASTSQDDDENDFNPDFTNTAIPHLAILLTDLVHFADGLPSTKGAEKKY